MNQDKNAFKEEIQQEFEKESFAKRSTPKVTKVNWKDFLMQDDFILRKHESLGWNKFATVKKGFSVKDVRERFGTKRRFGERGFAAESRHGTRRTY